MYTVAIVQARMGSSRLPGKTMADILGKPILWHLINRLRYSQLLDKIVIATTDNTKDETILELARKSGIDSYAGSEDDVLDRYYQAAKKYNAEVVVRITADCPLIDAHVVDKVINRFLEGDYDYATNILIRTYPDGLDVEVMSFSALEKAWREDRNPAWREHVTPYIMRHPEKFKIHNITNEKDYSYMRWTVDTIEDLTFVRKIYDHFQNDNFNWQEVLHLLEMHPEWLKINQHIRQKIIK